MRAKIESEIRAFEEKARNYFIQIKKYEDIEDTIQNAQQWNLNGMNQKGALVTSASDDLDRKKKVVNADDPYIVYCLSECDILEDLSLLSKSLEGKGNTDILMHSWFVPFFVFFACIFRSPVVVIIYIFLERLRIFYIKLMANFNAYIFLKDKWKKNWNCIGRK